MPPRSKANIVIKKTTSTTRARRPSVSTTTTATSRRPSEITTTTTTTENDRTHGFGKEREIFFFGKTF
jgi:hypothetical protein